MKQKLANAEASPVTEHQRGIDNLIRGLVDLLPKRDGIWPLDDRGKWLRLAADIFDLGFKAGDGEPSCGWLGSAPNPRERGAGPPIGNSSISTSPFGEA